MKTNSIKRICLFAGYNGKGIIEDYAIYYIKELSKIADIYYLEENVDENTLVLQKEEVDDIKWMSSKEVDQLYKNNKLVSFNERIEI